MGRQCSSEILYEGWDAYGWVESKQGSRRGWVLKNMASHFCQRTDLNLLENCKFSLRVDPDKISWTFPRMRHFVAGSSQQPAALSQVLVRDFPILQIFFFTFRSSTPKNSCKGIKSVLFRDFPRLPLVASVTICVKVCSGIYRYDPWVAGVQLYWTCVPRVRTERDFMTFN